MYRNRNKLKYTFEKYSRFHKALSCSRWWSTCSYQIWWQINRIERSSALISVKISEIQARANGRPDWKVCKVRGGDFENLIVNI